MVVKNFHFKFNSCSIHENKFLQIEVVDDIVLGQIDAKSNYNFLYINFDYFLLLKNKL